jgi:hypothetical protein
MTRIRKQAPLWFRPSRVVDGSVDARRGIIPARRPYPAVRYFGPLGLLTALPGAVLRQVAVNETADAAYGTGAVDRPKGPSLPYPSSY